MGFEYMAQKPILTFIDVSLLHLVARIISVLYASSMIPATSRTRSDFPNYLVFKDFDPVKILAHNSDSTKQISVTPFGSCNVKILPYIFIREE